MFCDFLTRLFAHPGQSKHGMSPGSGFYVLCTQHHVPFSVPGRRRAASTPALRRGRALPGDGTGRSCRDSELLGT